MLQLIGIKVKQPWLQCYTECVTVLKVSGKIHVFSSNILIETILH